MVVDALGKERKVLVRSERQEHYVCPDGRILGFVDGQLQETDRVPTVDECDYRRTPFRGPLQATARAQPAVKRERKAVREEAPEEAAQGDAVEKVQGLLRVRST
ncbi:MAG: hypothetical protein A2Y74_08375 [Actinobacteria bacterium RBG_13_63_9]|nr:MAG: hypothetical protein A2Y74_08375 [Actinobacteria bacterium RBG_13_63_9]